MKGARQNAATRVAEKGTTLPGETARSAKSFPFFPHGLTDLSLNSVHLSRHASALR